MERAATGVQASAGELPEGSSLYDYHQKVSRAYHTQRACLRPLAASLGLGVGQPRILSCIAAKGPITQCEVAECFEMDPGAVSRMLAALKRNGFVTVEPLPDNRRANAVTLTESGHSAIRAWDRHCAEVEKEMLEGFSPEERERFGDYRDRARANLSAAARREARRG